MADICQQCINDCCQRWCVDELLCATECCGCCHFPILYIENQNIPAGQILGQRTSDLRFGPFDPLATNGLENPKMIQKFHIKTDENGDVIDRYFNPLVPFSKCGPKHSNAYACGIFRANELFGDIAAAVAAGFLRIIDGAITGNSATGLAKII